MCAAVTEIAALWCASCWRSPREFRAPLAPVAYVLVLFVAGCGRERVTVAAELLPPQVAPEEDAARERCLAACRRAPLTPRTWSTRAHWTMFLEASLHRALDVFGTSVGRESDRGNAGPRLLRADAAHERIAVHLGHSDVADEDIERAGRIECLDGCARVQARR